MRERRIRVWAALFVVLAMLAAAGCGGGSSSSGGSNGGAASQKTIKVGLVTDIGGLNDRSFNHLAYVGLQRAQSKLGVEGKVLQSTSNADYVPNLQQLAAQHYDLVIGVGFLMGDALEKVAKAFPTTNFAIIDYAYDPPIPNVQGLLFKEQDAGYLAGYLARLVTKTNVVSTVGGQKIPPVDHYIAGFQAGAKASNPSVTTLNDYSQSFTNQAACKELALQQITQKSDVVFQVAGGCGLGALAAAKEKNVWGIGVDADQAYLGSYILTSAVKKVDVAVYDTIKKVVDGTFAGGGVSYFDASNGGTGIGAVSPQVPADVTAKLADVQKQVADGTIKPPDTVK